MEGTSSATCRRVSQLEAQQLLSSSSQVIYPARLNGCEVPIIASLPKLLAKGTNLLGSKPVYLKVDIPQPITEEPELKALLPLGSHSSSILMPSPIRAPLPKAEGEVSMTMEVRELLSQVMLDTSGHASRNSTPKRLNPMVLLTPPPQTGDFPRPVDTSSQVSAPDDAKMGDASLEEIPAATLPQPRHQGPAVVPLPADTGHPKKRPTRL